MKQAAPPNKRKGGWIGIDLGTSNCTAAVWDLERSRCKVLRLGFKNLARPPPGGSKDGKIVPSAVLFTGDDGDNKVGFDAISHLRDDGKNIDNVECDTSAALVTSFKRVVGMTSRQAKELQLSDEEFWDSLPFQAVIMDDDDENNEDQKAEQSDDGLNSSQDIVLDVLGDVNEVSHAKSTQQTGKKEGVAIRIPTLKSKRERLVAPLDVTTTLLQSIRVAANEYLTGKKRSKIVAPGMSPDCDTTTNKQPLIENCIIGVPAHYSVVQRKYIQIAAKEAGFSGYVGVMTESTAAAMAYGLFVSPNNATSTSSSDDEGKTILVFDMGGGTTDVTIAKMNPGESDAVQFRVLATSGDRCLGGDNVDELLARFVWKRIDSSSDVKSSWKASEHQELVRQCRCAKEELCGSDDTDSSGDVTIAYQGTELCITRTDFDQAIQHLVDRAEHVIDEALSALKSQSSTSNIHEVVLVGGSTYIPAIRTMLRCKFPPPVPPELCTSISATAVSQGLAIQAALVSGLVPLFELRNAMMLDTIPHSIGVWVCGSNAANQAPPYETGDFIEAKDKGAMAGHFVPILEKDTNLPAKGSTTFELANADQHGVSIVAVEHIGQDQYLCMGVFNFLLHRVEDSDNKRKIEVGMILKESGQFVVSIFDEKDPEHREKGRKYLESKGLTGYELEEKEVPSYSGNEIGLILFCVAFFALYVAVKVLFNDIELVDNEL